MEDTIRDCLLGTSKLYATMAAEMVDPIARGAELLIATLRGGGTIYVCGNGGSAGDAQHIAGELVGRFLLERDALPCVALSTNTSILTCIANDYSFDTVFERQVKALVRKGDLLWAISTSGNSVNVLKAAEEARRRGAKVLGMTGRTGGKLKALSDVLLAVPADATPSIQEGHLGILHILCRLVEVRMAAR